MDTKQYLDKLKELQANLNKPDWSNKDTLKFIEESLLPKYEKFMNGAKILAEENNRYFKYARETGKQLKEETKRNERLSKKLNNVQFKLEDILEEFEK